MYYILLIIFFIVAILIFSEYRLYYVDYLKEFKKVPGIKRLPIIGNGLYINRSPVQSFYLSRHVANVYKNKGNICRGQVVSLKIVNLYNPDDMEVLLSNSTNLEKGFLYSLLHPWLNEGLLTSKGEKWKERRKMLNPTFHFNILKHFSKIFLDESKKLVNRLKNEVGKPETDIYPLITDFSLNVLNETAMGTNLHTSKFSISDYKKAIYQMGEIFITRASKFWLYIPFIYRFSSTYKKEKTILNQLHGFTESVIKERRLKIRDTQSMIEHIDYGDNSISGIKNRMAMLDLLLNAESKGQIDDKGIREEVDTFMFAGHDTTSVSITYTLMSLANNPEAQMLVIQEIDEVLKSCQEPLKLEDYSKMNYLEMCIKESLRLYPSVPIISRHLTEDLKLKNYIIPSGVLIFVQIFDMHRNPELYPDPNKFIPERFLPENVKKRHRYAYIPFSAGPRNCIGRKFALLQEKVVISTILRKYKLEPVTRHEDISFVSNFVLRSIDPIKVKLILRE